MKKIKIFSLFMLGIVIVTATMFSACSSPDNIKITLSAEEVTYNISDEEAENVFIVTVEGLTKDYSKDLSISYERGGRVVASIEKIEERNKLYIYTIKVDLLDTGSEVISVTTIEGNKTAKIKVNVNNPITNMEYNSTSRPYAIIGKVNNLNTPNIVSFTPSNTMDKDVLYTLEEPYMGVTVKDNGSVYVAPYAQPGFALVNARSLVNPDLNFTFSLAILNDITEFGISFGPTGNKWEYIPMSTNKSPTSSMRLHLTRSLNENEIMTAFSSDSMVLEVESSLVLDPETGVKLPEIILRSGIEGNAKLTIRISIKGFEEFYVDASIEVRVREYPSYIYINEETSSDEVPYEIYAYDNYVDNNLGERIDIKIGGKNSFNRDVVLFNGEQLKKLDLINAEGNFLSDKMQVTYADGSFVNIKDVFNGDKPITLFVKSFVTSEIGVPLRFIDKASYDYIRKMLPKDESGDLSGKLDKDTLDKIVAPAYACAMIYLREGASEIILNYPNNTFYVEVGKEAVLEYRFDKQLATTDSIFVDVIGDQILDIKDVYDGKTNKINFKANKEGVTELNLKLPNGISKNIRVVAFNYANAYSINSERMEDNSGIGELSFKNFAPSQEFDKTIKTLGNLVIARGAHAQLSINGYLVDVNKRDIFGVNNPGYYKVEYFVPKNNSFSINSKGYLSAISVTNEPIQVDANIYYYETLVNDDGIQTGVISLEDKKISLSFTVEVYTPVTNVELNFTQKTIYDYNNLGIFDKQYGEFELIPSIFPYDSTHREVEIYFDDILQRIAMDKPSTNNGVEVFKFRGFLNSGITSGIANITVTVRDYNRVFVQKCVVNVKGVVKATNVVLENVLDVRQDVASENYLNYLYFDSRKEGGQTGSFTIQARCETLDKLGEQSQILNGNLRYVYASTNGVISQEKVVMVDEFTGKITPLTPGYAYVYVVAEDSISREDELKELSKNNVMLPSLRYVKILVKVADGLTKETAIEISNKSQFLSINTVENLKYHYVLTNSINLNFKNLSPIGLIDGKVYPFTGSLNGMLDSRISTIYGINYSNKFSENEVYAGLFARNEGEIYNINIEAINSNVINSNIENNGKFYFGAIAGINNGKIYNINVDLSSLRITTSAVSNHIGGIVGRNEIKGKVANRLSDFKVKGALTVIQGDDISNINQLFNVGGVAGYNGVGTVIRGTFNYYDDKVIINDNTSDVLVDLNFIKSQVDTDYHVNIKANSSFGGVVGYNFGKIENVFTTSNVFAKEYNNIGGIVGFTEYKGETSSLEDKVLLKNNYFTGSVLGGKHVGGIAGVIRDIYAVNNIVEVFDETEKTINPKIIGFNYIGGLFGRMVSSNVEFSFFKSYVNRELGDAFKGDISLSYDKKLDIEREDAIIGGIVGLAENSNINAVYADVTIVNENPNNGQVGGIAGVVKGTDIGNTKTGTKISNSFSKIAVKNMDTSLAVVGGIVGKKEDFEGNTISSTYTNQNLAVGVSFVEKPGLDTKCFTSNDNKNTIVSALNSLPWKNSPEIYDGYPYIEYDTKYMMSIIPVSIDIQIKDTNIITPGNIKEKDKHIKIDEDKVLLFYHKEEERLNVLEMNSIFNLNILPMTANIKRFEVTSSNEGVLQILDGKILLKNAGNTVLRFRSLLDRNVTDFINIEVMDAIYRYQLFTENSNDQMWNEAVKRLEILNGQTKQLYYIIEGNQNFFTEVDTTDKTILSINDLKWNKENKIQFNAGNMFIIKTLRDGDCVLQIKNYFFVNNTSGEKVKIYLPFSQRIGINIFKGIQSISGTPEKIDLTLKDIGRFDLFIDTDLSEKDLEITLNEFKELEMTIKKEIVSGGILVKIFYKVKSNFINSNQSNIFDEGKVFLINATVSNKLDADGENSFTFNHEVTFKKEKIYDIEMQYFADGEKIINEDGSTSFNVDELESMYIKTGIIGILKLKIYPNFTDLLKLDLTAVCSENPYLISFEQVLLDNDVKTKNQESTKKYVSINPSATNIENGVSLYPYSGIKDGKKYYDGTLYVKALLPSNILEGQEYKFTAKAYYKENEFAYKEMSLFTQTPKRLELSYLDSLKYANREYLALENEVSMNVNLSKIKSIDEDGVKVYNSKDELISKDDVMVHIEKIENISNIYSRGIVKIKAINPDLLGSTIKVILESTERLEGRNVIYHSNPLYLKIVNTTIKSISYGGKTEIPFGAGYEMSVKIETHNNFDLSNEVQQISRSLNSYYINDKSILVGDNGDFKIESKDNVLKFDSKIYPYKAKAKVAIKYYYDLNGQIKFILNDNQLNLFKPGRYEKFFIMTAEYMYDVYYQASLTDAIPIKNEQEFLEMKEGAHYILMNDLTFEKYTPLKTKIGSFDGNYYNIKIVEFEKDNSLEVVKANFGLFDTIENNMVIKNVNLLLGNENTYFELDITNIKDSYIGGIAGILTDGVIYNCHVKLTNEFGGFIINSTKKIGEENTNVYVGGIVGFNGGITGGDNFGFISYSSVRMNMHLNNSGYIAGITSINSGKIFGCEFTGKISHEGDGSVQNAVGGLVVNNLAKAEISNSFVSGVGAVFEGRQQDVSLQFNGTIGAFARMNAGNITDSYANIRMSSQDSSAGFVFENKGNIKTSYSSSYTEASSNSHTAFIGSEKDVVLDEGLVENCYYLTYKFANKNNQKAKELTLEQFNNEYYLNGFIVRDMESVWKLAYDNLPTLVVTSQISNDNEKKGLDAKGKVVDNTGASIENPKIISTAEEFMYYLVKNDKVDQEKLAISYVRIVADIDLRDYVIYANKTKILTNGALNGSNMTIRNYKINSLEDDVETKSSGLFASVMNYNLCNINLEPTEVLAKYYDNVGALVGSAENSRIYNITVNANDSIVNGKKYVGGVVGTFKTAHSSDAFIENVKSNISVNADYVAEKKLPKPFSTEATFEQKTAYAGGIIGVADLTGKTLTRLIKAPIYNLSIYKDVKVMGLNAGGIIGILGEGSYADMLEVKVSTSSYVRSKLSAGGIVGENRGRISRSIIQNANQKILDARGNKTIADSTQNISFFANGSKMIGGIVGFNNGGIVDNCITKIDVRNETSTYAGGIAGLCVGGEFYTNIVKSSVFAKEYVGGLIGAVASSKDLFYNQDNEYGYFLPLRAEDGEYETTTITHNSSITLVNNLAFNHYLKEDSDRFIYIQNSNYISPCMAEIISVIYDKDNKINITAEDNYGFEEKFSRVGKGVNDEEKTYTLTTSEYAVNNIRFGIHELRNNFVSGIMKDVEINMNMFDILTTKHFATLLTEQDLKLQENGKIVYSNANIMKYFDDRLWSNTKYLLGIKDVDLLPVNSFDIDKISPEGDTVNSIKGLINKVKVADIKLERNILAYGEEKMLDQQIFRQIDGQGFSIVGLRSGNKAFISSFNGVLKNINFIGCNLFVEKKLSNSTKDYYGLIINTSLENPSKIAEISNVYVSGNVHINEIQKDENENIKDYFGGLIGRAININIDKVISNVQFNVCNSTAVVGMVAGIGEKFIIEAVDEKEEDVILNTSITNVFANGFIQVQESVLFASDNKYIVGEGKEISISNTNSVNNTEDVFNNTDNGIKTIISDEITKGESSIVELQKIKDVLYLPIRFKIIKA